MIPILFETDETAFATNGLGRLRDCISCKVTEERNGIYECDFEYPLTGQHFDDIKIGRIIGVTHEESDDIEPFDIVSYERPINGVVSFHCVHVSYRQSYLTVTGSNINSLADAFALLATSTPTNPFTYETDKESVGFMSAADGTPKTVRSLLGGTEGSILDAYGGEYEWKDWRVILHNQRGVLRDFSIRYGVNMTEYNENTDSSGTYQSVIPYWTDGTTTIIGDKQTGSTPTVTGRDETVPLDVSDKFDTSESTPTKAEVEAMGLLVLNSKNTALPAQNISVSFVRLQDVGEFEAYSNLLTCKLCDTIKVIFPDYNSSGQFKIVKTVWDVLADRYESMELGDLSVTLSEALGISQGGSLVSGSDEDADDYVVEQGTSGIWTYRKWNSGIAEAWGATVYASHAITQAYAAGYWTHEDHAMPSGLFTSITNVQANRVGGDGLVYISVDGASTTNIACYLADFVSHTVSFSIYFSVKGRWK